MIVVNVPQDIIGLNTLLFAVGIGMGILLYAITGGFKEDKKHTLTNVMSVVFTILMSVGLMTSLGYNTYAKNKTFKQADTYIEKTTKELNDTLTQTSDIKGFNQLVKDLYQSEYEVIAKTYKYDGSKTTIGENFIKGGQPSISRYIGELGEDGRERLLETRKDSLNTFTTLDFARLDTSIRTESLKLGSMGNTEVLNTIQDQQEQLESKVSKLERTKQPVAKVITAILMVNAGFLLLSAVLTAVIYTMMLPILDEVEESKRNKLKFLTQKTSNQPTTSTIEEYELVDGELTDPTYEPELEPDEQNLEESNLDSDEPEVDSEESNLEESNLESDEPEVDEPELVSDKQEESNTDEQDTKDVVE